MTEAGGSPTRARVAATTRSVAWFAGAALPAVALAVLAVTVGLRVAYPYGLEWQETAMLEHARRVRDGAPLYVAPTPTFAPFPYPPMFHWLGAGALTLFGAKLWALRSLSIAATVALCALIFVRGRAGSGQGEPAVARGQGTRRPGGGSGALSGAGLFAAAYGATGGWFDVARVDMLALALGVGALELARSFGQRPGGAGRSAPIAAGLLLGASVLTKQTLVGLAVAVPLGLAFDATTRRAAAWVAITTVALVGAVTLWLEARSGGAFLFTTVDLLAGSPWHGPAVLGFWRESGPLLIAPILLWLLAGRPAPRTWVTPLSFAALVTIAWVGRAHEGGYLNTLIPAAVAVALGVASTLGPALERAPLRASLVVIAAFVLLAFDPRPLIPSAEDRAEGARVAARIDAAGRRVWQPGGPVSVGRDGFVHRMAIVDLLKSRETEAALAFARSLEAALDAREFDAVVLSHSVDDWAAFAPAIGRNYREVERLDAGARGSAIDPAFVPPTGAPIRPRVVLVPR